MNQSGDEWNPQAEELEDIELQGIRFSRIHPQSRRPETMQENRGLFVRNVPRELTNNDLKQLFSEHGNVLNVFVKLSGPGSKFNWAIVNTESVKDMLSMMSALNRKPPFNFDITVAFSEDEKRQRKRGRGDFIATQSTESSSVIKKDMESLSSPGSFSLMTQGAWNGAVGQVKSPRSSMNGALETGRGNVIMESSRHQACVFCGSQGQLRCSVCKAWYCSMVCQVDDWYHHKDACRSPPLLDDPCKVKNSLCGASSEVSRGPNAIVMSSFSSCTDNFGKDLRRGMLEEFDLCSSSKSCTEKEIQPTRSIGSLLENNIDKGLPKRNIMAENSYSGGRGAILQRSIIEEGSYGAGRGAIPKRNSMMESRVVGRCDSSPKGSIATESGYVAGRDSVNQKDADKSCNQKCLMPKGSLAEIVTDNIEKGASVKESEHSPKPLVAEKTLTPNNSVTSTLSHSSESEDSASPTVHDKINTSAISSSENAAENRLNFTSLLEKGKVYNGFITLVASYEKFTAVVVVEGTECIFSEAHEILSTTPPGINFKPGIGSLIAAYSPTEETWYRARVLDKDGSTYRVCYIDFGNKEAVEQVKPIPEGPFSELPDLAFLAKLHTKINDQVQEKLKEMVQVDSSIKFKVIAKKESCVKVALCEQEDEDDTAVAEYIFGPLFMLTSSPSLPASASSPKTKATPPDTTEENNAPDSVTPAVTSLQETSLSKEKKEDLQVHAVNDSQKENGIINPGQESPEDCNSSSLPRNGSNKLASSEAVKPQSYFVVPMKNLELILKLEEMSVEMNQYCESSGDSSHQPKPGEACFAKFAEDGKWYRALCIASAGTNFLVVFVDYGNTEKVCHANIRPIPRQFLEIPCLALYLPKQDVGTDTVKQQQTGQMSALSAFTFLASFNLSPEGKMEFSD